MEHVEATGSALGKEMLDDWDNRRDKFVKVMPHDYKRVLMERAARESAEAA
jgi:glutamate synthase domain-containing protein 3